MGNDAIIRQLEEELADTRWHLDASQRIARVGSWQVVMKDLDTAPGSHRWSAETFRMLGYEPGEVLASNELFFSHLPPEEIPIVERSILNSVTNCAPYDIEHHLIRKDGLRLLVRERGEAKYLDLPGAGRWVQLTGTVQDISSQAKAENYEASLKSIFDNTPLAYILLDENLNVAGFNKAALINGSALLGVTLSEGQNVLSFTEPARRAEVKELYTAVVHGKKHSYEHKFGGDVKPEWWCQINLFPVCLDKNRVMGMAISMEDITERKRAEETIRGARAKYQSFFKNSLNALVITKYEGPILEANPAACALFGMTEEEICMVPPHSLLDTSNPDFTRLLDERRRLGKAHGELEFIRKDGSRFAGLITSVVYTDADGEKRTSITVQDITEQKAAKEKLIQNAFELRRIMDQLSTFREEERTAIAREIHDELGQQLSTVKMGVYRASARLQERGLDDEITGRLLGEIDEAIKSVRRISSNLRPIILDYEGLTAALKWYASGFEKLHSIPVSMNMDMPHEVADKKISMTLFRILQETFTNIIRHAGATQISVDMRLREGIISLTIIDNGVGIDAGLAKEKRTFGLVSMKERTALVNGEYSIERYLPRGTITKVRVPYPACIA